MVCGTPRLGYMRSGKRVTACDVIIFMLLCIEYYCSVGWTGSRLLRVGPLPVIVLRSVWSSLGCCGWSSLS
ncbi:hypothetical protein RHMOL_Rhmol10G0133000 [Rhododendron molle]|uniref:Uncharacterized protein n=1 Tax=Rhododendron molle TaxID=49168 RepID=A0ACC0M222_RHOML|nr:hypothetical protein RHMOL_Rhmol10G0133000 [Rhododendron molle]